MSDLRIFFGLICAACSLSAATAPADRIVLLANADDPGSLQVASHYADVRGVPKENIVALHLPQTETITWAEFVSTIWQPLQDELVRRKWIDAIPMELTDEVGRRKYAMSGHRISYLVVCRGVPLRISYDPARYVPQPPVTDNPFFQTNEAAVDSELSLLAVTGSPINAFLANPLFGKENPTPWQRSQVVKVSRLDGPTVEDACALPDRAIEAERTGPLGRAYVDLGGLRPEGDRWLESAARDLAELGFDLDVDGSPATMPVSARFDAPVFYFGWYAANLNGPFTLPGFRFPPGAIAIHIHSDSATTLHSDRLGWSGPLVSRGVTATVGNVFEPYLQLLHRPDLLMSALKRGETFGDAVYFSEPVLSWQSIAIGDPLYRPFGPAFRDQWKNRATLPSALSPYAVLSEMHRREAAHHFGEALTVLRDAQQQHPTLVVGYALASALERSGDRAGAAVALASAATLKKIPVDEWALAHGAARLLVRVGAPDKAVKIYRALLIDPAPPKELRLAWMIDGRKAALAARDAEQATAWSDPAGELPTGK